MTNYFPTLTAAAVLTAGLTLASPAHADTRPVHEGGDTAACVTSLEFDVVRLGASQLRVKRVFDTPGVKVDESTLAAVPSKYRAPAGSREVRSYPVCPRPADGVTGGVVLAEFDTSGRRTPLVFAHYDEWVDWS
jgi:hypothetical protein